MIEFKNKRVFISGGAGVIGSALVEKLIHAGARPLVGDLKPRPAWPAAVQYRQGDLNYISAKELEAFQPEIFFHLAATFERSVETYDFWEENFHHNLKLSHHLMTCLKDTKTLKRVVFASSYLIYDPETYYLAQPADSATRLKETDRISPRNLCGTAKLMHEMELQFLEHFNHDLQAVSARIFRVYGKNSRDVISRWIRALLNGETLNVYRPEGLFDYIYADEVAEGLMRLCATRQSGIVNLGNDNARRVTEVLDILKQHFTNMKTTMMDSDIPYEASQANMDYFQQLTGWRPTKQLEDAIPEIIEFEKKIGFNNPTKTDLNILVTSISQKVPLLSSLRKANSKLGNTGKIFGGDIDAGCIGRYFVDGFWHMPKLSDLSKTDLLSFCQQNKIKAIVPTRDGELAYFAGIKDELLHKGITVMVSDRQTVEICVDKLAFYNYLSKLGFPVVPSAEDITELGSCERFVVKERFGAGSQTLGLDLSKEKALAHAQTLKEPIFQSYISGRELSIDLYVDKTKQLKGVVSRSRVLVKEGESQVTKIEENEHLENLMKELTDKVDFYGHIVLQVLIDAQDETHIIECNTRIGGASALSLEFGLDSFYWFLLEVAGSSLEEYPFAKGNNNLTLVRYKADHFL